MDDYEKSLRKKMRRDTIIGVCIIIFILGVFLLVSLYP